MVELAGGEAYVVGHYVEVAVAAGPVLPRRAGSGLPGVYSYHLPDGKPVPPGSLVEVPFGSRLLPGIVVGVPDAPPHFPTRPITRLLGDQPLLSPVALELASFIARTYRAPLFESLSLLLPPGFNARLAHAQRDGRWTPPRFRAQPSLEGAPRASPVIPRLTSAQRATCQEILAAFRSGRSQPFLLYGVTGSGKTLVYLEAVAEVVAAGRQAIVLASEIGLTPDLVARLRQRFPGQAALLHSRLTAAEHYRNWSAVACGDASVVIGSRSALFAPTRRLGLVVLDEEHEWTYKQESSPRYHARDVALELGRLAGVPVVLSSATPDVQTTWRAHTGHFRLLRLPGRYGGRDGQATEPDIRPLELNAVSRAVDSCGPRGGIAPAKAAGESPPRPDAALLPPVRVVDLRQELQAGNSGIFSRVLQTELRSVLARGEQAILFINRRGAATCVTCRHCGHVVRCTRCDIPLVYHRAGELLICHRCNRRRPTVETCPGCGGTAIRQFGVGTQRVEHELANLFPAVRSLRWDRDSGRGRHDDVLTHFGRQEAQVLIGTQMVAKALDFPLVTLVGVVLADVGLHLPDFRAGERSFQLLTQVAGRAGRGERPGRVVVQTYAPGHYAIRFAAAHDYDGFYEREITFRDSHGYPPFGRLVRFVYSGAVEQRCWREAGRLRRQLQARLEALADPELRVIGPAPCYVQRLRGRFRWQLVARGLDLDGLLDGLVLPPGWIIDVDPVSLL